MFLSHMSRSCHVSKAQSLLVHRNELFRHFKIRNIVFTQKRKQTDTQKSTDTQTPTSFFFGSLVNPKNIDKNIKKY